MAVHPDPKKYVKGDDKVYPKVTAKDISKSEEFQLSCMEKNVKPSVRQARDYRRKLGNWSK